MLAFGQALAAAEGVSGDDHPRVALPLIMLGKLFSRTGRVQLAEGMYRCELLVDFCLDSCALLLLSFPQLSAPDGLDLVCIVGQV